MAKSVKQLTKGATRRAVMKNADGTPIHYDQKDQAPVYESAGRVAYDNVKAWTQAANTLKHYIEDHGTHREAHHKAGGLVGRFDSHPDGEGRGHGYIDHPVGHVSRVPGLGEETVNELSQNTLNKYLKSAVSSFAHNATMKQRFRHDPEFQQKFSKGAAKRTKGITMARSRMPEMQIGEAVESLEQLYPIFEQNGMFEAANIHGYAAGQHAQHHLHDLHTRAQAMASHMRNQKAEPHNLGHQAKVSDHMDYVTKKHGHEAARYTHMAATHYAAGNDRSGDATIKGAHKHSLSHHGLLPEVLSPERAREAAGKAEYHQHLAAHAQKGGFAVGEAKHTKQSNRYKKLLQKEDWTGDSRRLKDNAAVSAPQAPHNPATVDKNKEHPIHNAGVAKRLAPLQSNGGLKKWRKLNGPPDHVERGPIKTDNVIEATIDDLPSWAHTAVAHEVVSHMHHHKVTTGKHPTEAETNEHRKMVIDRIHAKLASRKIVKEEWYKVHEADWRQKILEKHPGSTFQSGSGKTVAYNKDKKTIGHYDHAKGNGGIFKESIDEGAAPYRYGIGDRVKHVGIQHGLGAHQGSGKEGHVVDRYPHSNGALYTIKHDDGSTSQHAGSALRVVHRAHVKEEVIIEADSAKKMKRKYLGKSKGRTKVGTKAHKVDTQPKLVLKDTPTMKLNRMPMPSKGI